MPTIKDVARRAGISVTTTSRALNNHSDVAAETRARIQQIAREMDYHPNAIARSLQGTRTRAVGLFIPPVLHRSYDAFWLEFIGGVAAACAIHDFDLLLATAEMERETPQQPSLNLQRLTAGSRVDGVILCDIAHQDERVAYLQRRSFPFVGFGRSGDQPTYPCIDVDGEHGVAQAIAHLLALGHTRIGFLGVDEHFGFSPRRLNGYRQALATHDIAYDAALVKHGLREHTLPDTLRAMVSQPQPPTALFVGADFLALATLEWLHAQHIEVPTQMSLVVFDDGMLIEHAHPPLTALRQPIRQVGNELAHLLIQHLHNPSQPASCTLVHPLLVERTSTAPPLLRSRG